MANKIVAEIVINDKGDSLKIVTKNAKQAAQGIDQVTHASQKATKARNNHNKAEKGTAQLTNNSTKAFSKQAQTIGGSSGLVAAYATLAANVFAITAAFGVLKRTAAFNQLQEGLEITGKAAGQNLPLVAKELKNITDNAISTEAAMRAVAVGTSAGFDQSQLEGLTKVAKGASLALGRDMTDALDRLVRGTAKLEPEILDELGIMVRLDDVTEKYAASVGKAASDVSVFEKRMAFANAVVDQGTKKFALLADEMDPNPYDQLAATFDTLVKTIVGGASSVLEPIVKGLSSNVGVLLGSILLLSKGVASSMVPALTQAAERLADNAAAARDNAESQKLQLGSLGKTNKAYNTYIEAVQNGSETEEQRLKALKGLNASESLRIRKLEELNAAENKNTILIQQKTEELEEVQRAQRVLNGTSIESFQAASAEAKANAVNNASKLSLRNTMVSLIAVYKNEVAAKTLSTTGSNLLASANARLSASFAVVTTAARAAGVAFLTILPYLGLLSIGVSAAISLFNKFFRDPPTELEEAVKKSKERFDEFPEVISKATKSYRVLNDAASKFNAVLKPTAGLISQLSDQIQEYFRVQEAGYLRAKFRNEEELKSLKARREELQKQAGPTFNKTQGPLGGSLTPTVESGQASRDIAEIEEKIANLTQLDKKETTIQIRVAIAQTERALTGLKKQVEDLGGKGSEEVKLLEKRIQILNGFLAELGNKDVDIESIKNRLLEMNLKTKELNSTVTSTAEAIDDLTSHVRTQNDSFGSYSDTLKKARAILASIPEEAKGIRAITDQMKEGFKALGASGVTEFEAIVLRIEGLNNALEQVKIDESLTKLRQARFSSVSGNEVTILAEEAGLINTKLTLQRQALDIAKNNTKDKAAEIAAQVAINNLLREQVKVQKELKDAKFKKDVEDPTNLSILKRQEDVDLASRSNNAIAIAQAQVTLEATKRDIAEKRWERDLGNAELELAYKKQVLAVEQASFELSQAKTEKSFKFGGEISQATGTTVAGLQGATDTLVSDDVNLSDKVATAQAAFQPMLEQLEMLGPDGEILSSIIEGAFTMTEAFTNAFETINSDATKLEKVGSIVGAVGASISAISNIQAAQTRAAVAGIDKQIAAEKKRDGKSKESLQKIAELEKKKEQLQKKQFEKDKKMKMAQVVMATALGIMQAFAQGGMLGFVTGAIIAAIGAAQLAAISSSSFEGGGSSAAAPEARGDVKVGERSNSVDLSKSQGASGELSYLRGESGVGKAENFRPAFTGARYRAAGGSAGYIVGEQGPELFVPETPGTIVPAGDTANLQPSVTHLNFSISAIDAAGVEEVLNGQRGNIIRMIRETANDAGETFMEGLDERF